MVDSETKGEEKKGEDKGGGSGWIVCRLRDRSLFQQGGAPMAHVSIFYKDIHKRCINIKGMGKQSLLARSTIRIGKTY